MTGSSIKPAPEQGQEVRVDSVPREWMKPLVGLKGIVGAVRHNENTEACRIDGLTGEPWWFASGHLSVAGDAEKEAS